MSNSKLTLIIDGNWLLMSRLCKNHGKYNSNEELLSELKENMLKAIHSVTRIYTGIDNIIFVADGGSWRNDITPPQYLQDKGITYKGNRQKSDEYDWDVVFEFFGNFMQELSDNGITAVREEGVEGDDWIWYWSKKLNAEGTNCIIWSKDKDLTQLVSTDNNGCFTIWWNRDNGVYMENKDTDELDWFFNNEYNDNTQILENIIRKTSTTKITPSDVVIDKVVRGDSSDNIIPIIKRKCNTDKEYRISEKELDLTIDIFNESQTNEYISRILTSPKFVDKVKKSVKDIREHLKYNLQIVALDKRSYPQHILDTLNKYDTYNKCCDVSKMIDNTKVSKNAEIVDILETI